MATQNKDIIRQVRQYLVEPAPKFWSDQELLDIFTNGCKDLWGAILDVYGDHYLKVDNTRVSMPANSTQLVGVPTDVFRVQMIEPRNTTNAGSSLIFRPKKLNSRAFISARQIDATEGINEDVIYYDVSGVGAPDGAPTIYVGPQISTAVDLLMIYNPTLGPIVQDGYNPVPGESDQALIAYTLSFARAKESESRAPDAGWLAIYATEKQAVLRRITPRQDQESETVEGLFDSYYE
jgi:hypothetical protein